MDNQSNNKSVKNTSSKELELKIRRERINKGKKEESHVKQPRRYNPMNSDFEKNETINNQTPTNGINNNPDFQNKNEDSFKNNNEQAFDNKNINSFNDEDNSLDKTNDTNDSPIANQPQPSFKDHVNQLENNNQEVDNKQNNNLDNHSDNGQNVVSQSEENQNPQQLNNNSQIRNQNSGGKNNFTKDPTQRKLDRINNQKKQQEENNLANSANNKPTNPNENKPKTKGSAPEANKPKDDKTPAPNNKLSQMNQMKDSLANAMSEGQSLGEAAKTVAKEKAKEEVKKKIREKILEFIIDVILPILPYIAIFLIVVFLILFIVFAIMGVFDDEDNVVNTIKINYCENVYLKWGDGEDQNASISSDEYIKYKVNSTEFKKIDDLNALKALTIVLRTNLYANSDNLDSNTCNFEVDKPYEKVTNEVLDQAMEETGNKVFSVSPTVLSEIDIDEHFTYRSIDGAKYRLFQDKWGYDAAWVEVNIGLENVSNDYSDLEKDSFSPFAAWYLSKNNDFDPLSLIFHYVTPGYYKGNIYKVVKLRSGNSDDSGYYSGLCSDISLTTTNLSRAEFIEKVNTYNSSYSAFSIFKTNAGKIYDIATNNNFNPEMVVIRAISEGFDPGGSTNNYWGIGCTNSGGRKACKSYSSFDEGVLGYIQTVKKINSVSLFEMKKKYAYIGDVWLNPGSWSKGGCKYYDHVKKYLSESRAAEVGEACDPSKPCSGSACLPTTDEDQTAYTRYQIESMLQHRANVFGISADDCEEAGMTEDVPASELGQAVADYAVKTYDSWQYSQGKRHQDGYVDCSSLVSRAYSHFNVKVYNSADNSGEIYRWCEQNGKVISGGSLAPGDIIFWNSGSHSNSEHYKGIGHVELYIGNGQKFGAHSHYDKHPQDDVSIKSYNNDGNLFCRPASATQ